MCEAPPAAAWTKLTVRDGEKGPLEIEILARRVESKVDRRVVGFEETLVVIRYTDGGVLKHDYYLSNADPTTSLGELTRVAKAAHRIEECFERAKGEAGLADYQVRTWRAWQHHQTLALLAAWFLTQETRRGKKIHAGVDGPAGPVGDRAVAAAGVGV